MATMAVCCIALLSLCLLGVDMTRAQDGPIVDTLNGQLMGSYELYNDKPYEAYLGVPFALPPVGEFRWQRAQPPANWAGVRNATEYSFHCLQTISSLYVFLGMGSQDGEDCLYLNVWVPNGVAANAGKQLPVMFWIYGGAFTLGTGEMYPGWGLAVDGDVIVVNFNYRLNIFGWFSTGDEAAPGNYGAWDAQMAIQWVRDNIAQFNGDPSRITIFGQSAGGCLVSICLLSPQINTLFQQGIAVSGNVEIGWTTEQPAWTAVTMADIFNCGIVNTTQDIVNCLMPIDADVLLLGASLGFGGLNNSEYYSLSFWPVVDGTILTKAPDQMYTEGSGSHIKFISGNAMHDAAAGTLAMPLGWDPFNRIDFNAAATNESMILTLYAGLLEYTNPDELFNAIWNLYPEINTEDNLTRTIEYTQLQTDKTFGAGSNWEAAAHASFPGAAATYSYEFAHRQSFLDGYPDWVTGSHLDDVYTILGEPYMDFFRSFYIRQPWDATDYAVSRELMDYYSNFAHNGDPNVGNMLVDVVWEPFDPARNNHIREAPTFSQETVSADRKAKYDFWMKTFPAMVEYPPEPTFPIDTGTGPGPVGKDLFGSERKRLTFDDVVYGYELYKEHLYESLGEHVEAWTELEKTLDERFQRGIASRWN